MDTFITSMPVHPHLRHDGPDLRSPATLVIVFSRSRTGFRKTDTILNRLIRGAIQTGLFAGIFSTCNLITFLFFPNTNLYGTFAIPVGRIYTNVSVVDQRREKRAVSLIRFLFCFQTLLDTLLVRESLKAEMDGTDHMSGRVSCVKLLTFTRWSLIADPCAVRFVRLGNYGFVENHFERPDD